MPDDSLACLLGEMKQELREVRNDLKEIRDEQKRLATYVDTQKIGVRILTALAMAVGGLFVYYKEHLETIIFGTPKQI